MKALMPTVAMPMRDWALVLAAVGSLHSHLAKRGKGREADEVELVGRQIARACRHQARARKKEGKTCG